MAKPAPQPADLDPDRDIFDQLEEIDPEMDERRRLAAEADIAAGRVISHEAVKRWLLSWGTENELPRPKCGE